jgi:hypothetical protein
MTIADPPMEEIIAMMYRQTGQEDKILPSIEGKPVEA